MIEVTISDEGGELGKITLEKIADHPDGSADYSARFAVDRVGAVGIHQRHLDNFPRLEYNALALLLQALNTLTEQELRLEDGISPPDMARQERGALSEIQAREGKLHHY